MFKKIRDAIAMLMFLFTLFTAFRGLAALGRDLVLELRNVIRRRLNRKNPSRKI